MRKTVTALAAVMVLLTMGAADSCKSGEGDKPKPKPKPTKVQAPNPNPNPEVPAADPGPQNDKDRVLLKVVWIGERRGNVHVRINTNDLPIIYAPKPTKIGRHYSGHWDGAYSLSGVTTIGFSWEPDAGGMPAQCTIYHLGLPVDYQGVNGGPCAVSWTRK
jgi:hypothetical protein